ncbi:hypothetical protein Tco_0675961 [Tanacetum coccineum]
MANQEQNPPQQEQPFVAAKQVGFNLEDILLNTNNEVALLYLEHNNKDYFKCVSDFISKCCLRKPFTKSPNMYKEYLAKFWQWFPTIGYGEEVSAKGTLRNSLLPPRWSKEVTKGGSSKAPTGSKTIHSKKRKESSSTMDSNPSQPPVSTLVDTGMHKEEQQATGGPTSLGVTSEVRANPQLSSSMSTFNLNEPIYSASFIIHVESASGNDALAASIAKANPGNSVPSDFVPQQQGMNEGTINTSYDHLFTETSSTIKLEDLAKLVSHVQPSFKDLDSPEDDLVIVVNDSDEDEDDEVHATENVKTEDTSVRKSSSPISLPTELKELPSKFNDLAEEWELVAEFLVVPSQVERVQAKMKTLDALPSLDDHAKTFSSLLLAEIDKRNLNPLKQMRVIEQLRQ